FHGHRPVAEALHVKKVCFRAERQKQMIKLEIQFALRNATFAADYSACQINCAYIGLDNLHVTKNATQRINNVAGIKIARCDFVPHRRKENEIIATDQCHFYVRSTCEPFLEVHCRVKPGKPTTGNDYSSRFHAITANRNATRVIKILLMAPSFSLFPIFFSSFSASKF